MDNDDFFDDPSDKAQAASAYGQALLSPVTPQQAAQNYKLAKEWDIAPTGTSLISPEMKASKKMNEYQEMMANIRRPVFDRLVREDPNFATLVKDDITNVGAIESLIYKLSPTPGVRPDGLVDSSWNSTSRGLYNLGNLAPVFGNVPRLRAASERLQELRAIRERVAKGESDASIFGGESDPTGRLGRLKFDQNVAQEEEELRNDIRKFARSAQFVKRMADMFPQSADMDEFNKADGFIEAVTAFAKNPLSVLANTGPESLVEFAPGLGLAALTGGYGLAAQMGVTTAYSYGLDAAATLAEGLDDKGVNLSDEDSVIDFFSDPANNASRQELFRQADEHAAGTSIMDGLSLGAARFKFRFGRKVPMSAIAAEEASKRMLWEKMGNMVAQTQIQGVMGGAGEALGQLAAYGKIKSWSDVIAEYAGEHFSAPMETFTAAMSARREAAEVVAAAEKDKTVISAVATLAHNSSLQMSPEATADYMDSLGAQYGVEAVDIDVQLLGRDNPEAVNALLQAVPEKEAEIRQAIQAGGTVSFKMSEFAGKINEAGLLQSVIDYSHTEMNSSVIEAAEAAQSLSESALLQVNRAVENESDAFKAELAEVGRQIEAVLGAFDDMSKTEKTQIQAMLQILVANAAKDMVGVNGGLSPKSVWEKMGITKGLTDKDVVIDKDGLVTPRGPGNDGPSAKGIMGAYINASRAVVRLAGADKSTFLHESGHWFLGMRVQLALGLKGLAEQTEGTKHLVESVEKTIKWLNGGKDMSLAEFSSMPLDKRRAMEELFARTFEKYVSDGQAPTSALASVFRKFRAWLKDIYAFFNIPGAAPLSEEVRALYDDLFVASTEVREAALRRNLFLAIKNEVAATTDADKKKAMDDVAKAYAEYFQDFENEAMEKFRKRGEHDITYLREMRDRAYRSMEREARKLRAQYMEEELANRSDAKAREALERITKGIKRTNEDGSESVVQPRITIEQLKAAGLTDAEIEAFGHRKIDIAAKRKTARVVDGEELAKDLGYSSLSSLLEDLKPLIKQKALNELGVSKGKLYVEDLRAAGVSEDTIAKLKKRSMLTESAGSEANVGAAKFAKEWGFSDVKQMADAMANLKTPEQEAEDAVQERMVAEHPELAEETSIKEAADAAIFNTAAARLVATEIDYLDGLSGPRRTSAELYKTAARMMLGNSVVSELNPRKYRTNASSLARQAQDAMHGRRARKGESGVKSDPKKAAALKRQELFQISLAKESQSLRDHFAGKLKSLRKRFSRIKSDPHLSIDYLKQVRGLLYSVGICETPLEDTPTYGEFLAANSSAPDMPIEVAQCMGKPFKDLTVDQLDGVLQFTRQLIAQGEREQLVRDGEELLKREEVENALLADLDTQGKKPFVLGENMNDNGWGKFKGAMRTFLYAHARMSALFKCLSGKEFGAFFKYIMKRQDHCRDLKAAMKAESTGKFMEAFAPLMNAVHDNRRVKYDRLKASLSRHEIVAIALQLANPENTARLIEGSDLYANVEADSNGVKHKWKKEDIIAVVESVLTEDEIRALDAVWATCGMYWGKAAELELKTTGKEPKKVESEGITLNGIKLKGGYYPIRYDRMINGKATERSFAESPVGRLQGAKHPTKTRQGQMQDRTGGGGQAVALTFEACFDTMNAVIHDIAWREALMDFNKLFDRKGRLANEIRKYWGNEPLDAIQEWLDDVAADGRKTSDVSEVVARAMGANIGLVSLGFNCMSAAVQIVGYTQSVAVLGPKYAAIGLGQSLGKLGSAKAFVQGKSLFMKDRANNRFRELAEAQTEVAGSKYDRAKSLITHMAYLPITFVQMMVDIPTWLGAYQMALDDLGAEHLTGDELKAAEAEAVARADRVVADTQGSGSLSDLAAVERGGAWKKLFTVFYTFFNTTLNAAASSLKTKGKVEASFSLLLMLAIQPMIETALRGALKEMGGGDDDDWRNKEKAFKTYAIGVADFNLGLFMGLRELSGIAQYTFGEGQKFGYSGSPGMRKVNDLWKLAGQIGQGELDYGMTKAAANVAADWLGVPGIATVNRFIDRYEAIDKGKNPNWLSVFIGVDKD